MVLWVHGTRRYVGSNCRAGGGVWRAVLMKHYSCLASKTQAYLTAPLCDQLVEMGPEVSP